MEQLSEIMPFDLRGNQVRTVTDDQGKPWFIARDVALILGYALPQKAVRDHCKQVKILKCSKTQPLDIPPRGVQIIQEPDVYRLIMRSDLPSALAFQDWICDVVLPTIRKTGGYIHATPEMSDQEIMERARKVAEATLASRAAKAVDEEHGNTNIINI
ncbi:Bro-N domain-containing protein [Oceanidesulfovibrio marinus]|nr:BRO family protein [Oceanidesulfovibrio marinus]